MSNLIRVWGLSLTFSERFIHFCFASMSSKMHLNRFFFHYFLLTQIVDGFQTSTGLSVYVYGGLQLWLLTLPATILFAKPIL